MAAFVPAGGVVRRPFYGQPLALVDGRSVSAVSSMQGYRGGRPVFGGAWDAGGWYVTRAYVGSDGEPVAWLANPGLGVRRVRVTRGQRVGPDGWLALRIDGVSGRVALQDLDGNTGNVPSARESDLFRPGDGEAPGPTPAADSDEGNVFDVSPGSDPDEPGVFERAERVLAGVSEEDAGALDHLPDFWIGAQFGRNPRGGAVGARAARPTRYGSTGDETPLDFSVEWGPHKVTYEGDEVGLAITAGIALFSAWLASREPRRRR